MAALRNTMMLPVAARSRFCFVLFSVFIFIICSALGANSLLPSRPDGFVYSTHPVDSDTIIIEAFLDPICPDSGDAWWPLKQALDHYGSRVWLVVHLLPLPYHDNAFVTSRALHIIDTLNSSATFNLLELFFKRQEKFYNAQTFDLSRAAVVKLVAQFATQVLGNSYYSDVAAGFQNRKTDLKTRVSFKLSASRGVSATPSFFVNGFLLPDAGSPISFDGWRNIIDPLISAKTTNKGEEYLRFLW